MKENYSPKHLSKKQRHLKKWIPKGIYCDTCKFFIQRPFHHISCEECEYYIREDEEPFCDLGAGLSGCIEPVTYCAFLQYTEIGQDLFWDGSDKKCQIRSE